MIAETSTHTANHVEVWVHVSVPQRWRSEDPQQLVTFLLQHPSVLLEVLPILMERLFPLPARPTPDPTPPREIPHEA